MASNRGINPQILAKAREWTTPGRAHIEVAEVGAMAKALLEAVDRWEILSAGLLRIQLGSWNFGNLRPGLTAMEYAKEVLAVEPDDKATIDRLFIPSAPHLPWRVP